MSISRIMSIDYGKIRIGIAMSDPLKIIARPLEVIDNSGEAIFDRIVRISQENQVEKIIIGLPLNLKGEETLRSMEVREFAAELQERITVAIEFWDERYSSIEADEVLKELGYSIEQSRKVIDKIAAAVILKNYLESLK